MSLLTDTSQALQECCKLWSSQDFDSRELDEFKQGDNSFEIRFAIPNGGIIGVSIWALKHQAGWYLPTELHPNHTPAWHHNPQPNLALAKAGLKIVKKFLRVKQPRRPKPRSLPSNITQLSLLDNPLAYSSESSPPIALPTVVIPKAAKPPPKFAVGDVVIAIKGRELKTHKNKPLTITGFSKLGRPLIQLPIGPSCPVDPNNIRPATVSDFTEPSPPEPVIAPTQAKCGDIFKEWRWWSSTNSWTFTGAMGFSVKCHHPNSALFEASINPNELPTHIPN